MYTIQPSNEVRILTDPPNLVEVGIDEEDGKLYLKFVPETILENPTLAGVIVEFPSSQLRTIQVCCDQDLQVKDGFTNVQEFIVASGATAQAIFSNANTAMEIEVLDGSTATIEVGTSSRNSISVLGDGSGSFVNIAGDIATVTCTDRATCTVAGTILDTAGSAVEEFSTLETESCFGIFVEGGSTCDASFPFVNADVDGATTISGVTQTCTQASELFGNNPDSPAPSQAPTPEGFTYPPTRPPSPTPPPTQSFPTPAPTPFPTPVRSASPSSWTGVVAAGACAMILSAIMAV
jgi:hypothetical protein